MNLEVEAYDSKVERAARAMFEFFDTELVLIRDSDFRSLDTEIKWNMLSETTRNSYRRTVKAVIKGYENEP